MSATITPTILAHSLDEYRQQLERIPFARRIQVDISDGEFTDKHTINAIEAHWPDDVIVDFHLMVDKPRQNLEAIVAKQPNLVIVHAESNQVDDALDFLAEHKQRTGIALLPQTHVESMAMKLAAVEHCLIFGGQLGHMGGYADLTQLDKISYIKEINPDIEIGWDGGANKTNVARLAEAGVDVINVGSAIQSADNPKDAYATLQSVVEGV
jgi:ribulose-phosphate 3-epimerase